MIKKLNINDQYYEIDVESLDIPLSWILRDLLGMTNIGSGCSNKECEHCTVWLNGHAVRSCVTPLSQALNNKLTVSVMLPGESTFPLSKEQLHHITY